MRPQLAVVRYAIIVSDNGTEFTSTAVLAFTQAMKLDWRYIAPGKPMQNGNCEAFNGEGQFTPWWKVSR